MIRAVFFQGGNVRKILVTKDCVTLISSETNYEPIEIKVNEMLKPEIFEKIKGGMEWVKDIKKLKTEREMFNDIKTDFKHTGWRLATSKEIDG